MGLRVALDTNAYRAFVDGDEAFIEIIRNADEIGFPIVTIGELKAGFLNGTRNEENNEVLAKVLSIERVSVYVATIETASMFTRIWAALRKVGKPIPTNDIWIAALAIENEAALLTKDAHFRWISELATLPSSR